MADVYGVGLPDLEELGEGEFTPFEAVVMLKGFMADGSLGLVVITSDGLPPWELLGMAETLKQDAVSVAYLSGGEDDEL